MYRFDEEQRSNRGELEDLESFLLSLTDRRFTGVVEQGTNVLEHSLALGRQRDQAARAAREQLKAELVLQLFDLLRQPRLRAMHLLGRNGDVQAGIDDGGEVAQLRESHRPSLRVSVTAQIRPSHRPVTTTPIHSSSDLPQARESRSMRPQRVSDGA